MIRNNLQWVESSIERIQHHILYLEQEQEPKRERTNRHELIMINILRIERYALKGIKDEQRPD